MGIYQEAGLDYLVLGFGLSLFIMLIFIVFICGRRKTKKMGRNKENITLLEIERSENANVNSGSDYYDCLDEDRPHGINETHSQVVCSSSHYQPFSSRQGSRVMSEVLDFASQDLDLMDIRKHGYREQCGQPEQRFASYMSLYDIVPKRKFESQEINCRIPHSTSGTSEKPPPLPPRHPFQPMLSIRGGSTLAVFGEMKQPMDSKEQHLVAFSCQRRCHDDHLRTHQQPCSQHTSPRHQHGQQPSHLPRSVPRLGTKCFTLESRRQTTLNTPLHENRINDERLSLHAEHPQNNQGGGYFIPSTGDSITDLRGSLLKRYSMKTLGKSSDLTNGLTQNLQGPDADVYSSYGSILSPILAESSETQNVQNDMPVIQTDSLSSMRRLRTDTERATLLGDSLAIDRYFTSKNKVTLDTESEMNMSTTWDLQKCNYLTACTVPLYSSGTLQILPECATRDQTPLSSREIYDVGLDSNASLMNKYQQDTKNEWPNNTMSIPVSPAVQRMVGAQPGHTNNIQEKSSSSAQQFDGIFFVRSVVNPKVKVFSVPRNRQYELLYEDDI